MARQKKDSKPFSIRMDKKIYDKLEAFCEDSGQPKTLAIERAVNMYIDDYEKKMKHIIEFSSEKDGNN